MWGNYETDEPIGTKFGTRLRINLGIDIGRQKKFAPRDPRWAFGIFRGSKIQKSGKSTKGWTNWHNIWYMSARRLKQLAPRDPMRAFLGF